VVILNYDVLAKHRTRIDKRRWDLLIADESQMVKSPKASRTKALIGYKNRKTKEYKPPIAAKYYLCLTGTPIMNRPKEIFTFLYLVDPSVLGANYYQFATKYCDAHMGKYGWDDTGASNLTDLQAKLRGRFMVRRLKRDVLTQLPPKRHQIIELPANGAEELVTKEKEIYEGHQALIQSLETALETGEDADEIRKKLKQVRKTAFAEMAIVRHELGKQKVKVAMEQLQEAADDHPIIVFAHHQDVLQAVVNHFGKEAVLVDGNTPLKARQAAVDRFQQGKVKVFAGNIQAAGVGITLTRSSHVIFLELSWVPAELAQASDRPHRVGQRESVLVQYLVFEDSLDSQMCEKLIAKQQVIDQALD
jgi:SWI/SNF-related matrix-associated actin-dependent regulator 1 of chromatin subfamily A